MPFEIWLGQAGGELEEPVRDRAWRVRIAGGRDEPVPALFGEIRLPIPVKRPELTADDGARFDARVSILPLIFARRNLDVVPRWASRNETIDVALPTFLCVDDGLGSGIVIHHRPFDRESAVVVVVHDQDEGFDRHLTRDAAV